MANIITLKKDLKLFGIDTILERGDQIEILQEYNSPIDMLSDNIYFRIWGNSMRKPVKTPANIIEAVEILGDMFSPMELNQIAVDGCNCTIVLHGADIGSFDFSEILEYLGEY